MRSPAAPVAAPVAIPVAATVGLALAGTHLFRQAVVVQSAAPAAVHSNFSATSKSLGSAVMMSVDKSIVDVSGSQDIPVPLGVGADLRVGLGWDFADVDGDGEGDTDLDLSCVAFDSRGQFMNACKNKSHNTFDPTVRPVQTIGKN